MSVARAGDTGKVHAGTYMESTEDNPWVPKTGWFQNIASIAPRRSGTSTNSITLMAFPGDEGRVTLDSQDARVGIFTASNNYWQIYGLRLVNSLDWAIASNPNTNNSVDHVHTSAEMSIGWRIENCLIRNVVAGSGGNSGGIAMWITKDWIVCNNRITNLGTFNGRSSAAAQAYGTAHSLFENNYVEASTGVFLKDHMLKRANPRGTYFEYELRNNELNVTVAGFVTTIRGWPNVESGSNYIHHNVMYGFASQDAYNAVVQRLRNRSRRHFPV